LFGPAGGGKTTLAASAADSPFGEPCIHFDAEGGSSAIEHRNNVDVADIKSWDEIARITAEFKKAQHGYKTVIWDNMTEIQKLSIAGIAGPGVGAGTDVTELQEYLKSTNQMETMVRTWRDMARFQGINVVFVLWDEEDKDKNTNRLKTMVQLTPMLQKAYPGLVDTVGWVGPVEGRPDLRVVDFTPSPKTHAKFRRAPGTPAQKIPYKIFYSVDNLPMADMLATMKGGVDWPTAKYPAPAQPNS
jgi:hypothetical protein